ncbi:MAG TPA: DUF4861 domain-containing protein [Chryseolinea sp.]
MKMFFLVGVLSILMRAHSQPVLKDFPAEFIVTVTNPIDASRENVLVVVPSKELPKTFNHLAFLVMDDGKEIPSQYNATESHDSGIAFVLDHVGASETRSITIRFHPSANNPRKYPKRTQAEISYKRGGSWKNREYIGGNFENAAFLRVPPEHKDHSWFIRYEGPGWESDKVGYRFYLDQRNATDVFGKVTTEMILQKVGLDGFDSYHQMQPWGMDVMKVGKSLGIGSVGSFVNGEAIRVAKTDSVTCQIAENGSVYSSILTKYYGWNLGDKKHDLYSHLAIHAGTRVTQHRLTVTSDIENIATGIVKDTSATLIKNDGDAGHLAYIATYGKQSLNADNLGLAVFYDSGSAIETTDDTFSHVVTLKPQHGKVNYYFLSAWEKEPAGIKNQTQFEAYLRHVARELANPLKVTITITK